MKEMRNSVRAAGLVALALAVLVPRALGGTRDCTVFRAKTPPRLDACFDDECWRAVPWQTGFTFPGDAAVGAPFQTQFAMVWDDQCLYVAVRALEPETGRLVARAPRGSNDLLRDDRVEVLLGSDTLRSGWRQFVVNPLGRALEFTYAEKKVAARQVLPDAAPWRCACASRPLCWEAVLAIPLAELKIEPREGAEFAGNIARTRAVEQPAQDRTTWAPLMNENDESEAFVTFRLGGLPPAQVAARSLAVDPGRDRVTTLPGDRFTGKVLGLGEDGWLHIRCPEFLNEVRVRASAVDRVELALASPPGTGARIALANGDFILGEVRSIGPEQTVVASDALGELTLPTPSLSEVRLNAAARSFLDTPFDAGDMEPWMPVRGKWEFGKGRLVSPGDALNGDAIAAILPQDGPITFEVDVEAAEEASLDCEVVLFASQTVWTGDRISVNGQPARPRPRSGVTVAFRGNGLGNVAVWNGSPSGRRDSSQPLRFVSQAARSLQLRCSYDPKEGAVRAWQGEQAQGPISVRNAPKEGRYVVFIGFSPVAIRRLRVWPGIVAPGSESEPAAGSVRVALMDGSVLTAQGLTLADGRFSLQTGQGEVQPEPGGVAAIEFGGLNGRPSAAEAAAVRVGTSEGRFTLRSCVLSADRLIGQSEILGALSIPRDRVRSIQFLRGSP
jgi:hypothetical protein